MAGRPAAASSWILHRDRGSVEIATPLVSENGAQKWISRSCIWDSFQVDLWSTKYTQNGILHMLDRNRRIKPCPERFQECPDRFDLILTCEERVYDQVVEDLSGREQESFQPVHVINVDVQDNHEDATLGAFLICELCQCIQLTEDLDNEIDELVQDFEEKSGKLMLHTVCFY